MYRKEDNDNDVQEVNHEVQEEKINGGRKRKILLRLFFRNILRSILENNSTRFTN